MDPAHPSLEGARMKISIVTPAFNQAQFLPDALRSVEEQRGIELEHILVDPLSTDATPEIIAAYAARTGAVSIREPDRGQSDGINKGVARASGEVVSWLNSDDLLEPGALAAVVRRFGENPDAVAVCGVGSKVDRAGALLRTVPHRPFDRIRLRTALEFIQPATFIRRSAWNAVGGLDESLHYAMDWDLLLKLAALGPVVSIPEKLARIRYYEDTKTSTGGWKRAAEIARIGRRHNGPLDPNNLSYVVRCVAAPVKPLRRYVDGLFWKMGEVQPIMVCGWPDDAGGAR